MNFTLITFFDNKIHKNLIRTYEKGLGFGIGRERFGIFEANLHNIGIDDCNESCTHLHQHMK